VIAANDWVPDDAFMDDRHVFPSAAAPFTERFVREGLRPLLGGRHPSPDGGAGFERSPEHLGPAH
jgi:hypothetical protein